jgi:hypothetical protein
MKKYLIFVVMGLVILFVGSGSAFARHGGGQGGGGQGGGYCGGTGVPYICEGTQKTYSGVVTAINIYGAGLGANLTIDDTHTIFGLGPWWFWNDNDVNLPAVGDTITVDAMEIEISGTERIVAMSVTVTDDKGTATIQLRDTETCYPNWAGGWSRSN